MPNLQTFWVHGTSVHPQNEDASIYTERFGWGATFRSEGPEWFHFAIPTPVTLDSGGVSLTKLKRVFVLFEAGDPWGRPQLTAIEAVHVWDGGNQIAHFSASITGQHFQALDRDNTWNVPLADPINFGLGISVLVRFPANGLGWVTFMGAGAEFETP